LGTTIDERLNLHEQRLFALKISWIAQFSGPKHSFLAGLAV
jgi:hypothetical protein